MAKLALQLQGIVIVLTFCLIVIDHYVCGTSEPLRIYRGDYDTFDNPGTNCTAMNAKCTEATDTESGCLKCMCFGQYKTYLRNFDRCVRANKLLFFPVGKNSFMIQHYPLTKMSPICITYDRPHHITVAMCNSSDSSQRWIWTQYSQLLHVETLKCIQRGQMFPGKDYTWYLDLEECNISETKQKWKCEPHYNLQQTFFQDSGQRNYMYITYENDITLGKVKALTKWERYQSMPSVVDQGICSSSFGCNEFTNPSSAMLVLDSKCQQQGEQQIADLPKDKKCSVIWGRHLQVWDYHDWKHPNHEFRENIFAISNTWASDKFLKWNFTRAPSNWTNLIIKLNFSCLSVSEAMDSHAAGSTRCVLIKLKYSSADCPTTTSTTVSSSEAATPTPTTSAATSNGTLNTSHAPSTKSPTRTSAASFNGTTSSTTSTKSPTSSKEQQEGESSSVVGIVVGLLVAILALCGIILGYCCYKRRKSRSVDKTSSNVEINGKGQSSGNTLNPIYSSGDNNNPSFSNDGGIYQEPDGNISAASQACDLYEPADDHEYDYAKVEQKNKPAPPSAELEYDYAKTDDIKSAVQRLPVKGNDYQDTIIKNKNASTDVNVDKETENKNDTGPLYQTLEDDTGPVYQTLDSE